MKTITLKAIFSPFAGHHIKATLIIPGSLFWAMFALVSLSGLIAGLFFMEGAVHPMHGVMGMLLLIAILPVSFILSSLLAITVLGYQWRMIATLQLPQNHADYPTWNNGDWQKSFITGLHLAAYISFYFLLFSLLQHGLAVITGYDTQQNLLSTPVPGDFKSFFYIDPQTIYPKLLESQFWITLTTFACFTLLIPFILGPLFYNAQECSLSGLVQNLWPAWRWTCSRYLQVCATTLFIQGVLGIVFGLIALFLGLTIVGSVLLPFLAMSGILLSSSLYVSAFSLPPNLSTLLCPIDPES
jgi:hypothetical protein